MTWARPSDIHRALECPASVVLPKAPDSGDERPSAAWGKEVHAWKEGKPPTKRVQKWLDEQGWTLGNFRDKWWPGGEHEVAYHITDTQVIRYTGIDRETYKAQIKPKLAHEDLFGYVDWETDAGVAPWIDDLKTGRFHPGNPLEIPQKLVYGLAKVRLTGRPGTLLSITHLPRYPKGTLPDRWTEYATAKYLREWEGDRLIPARRLALSEGAHELVRPGAWCQWCRCAPSCPAQSPGGIRGGADAPNPGSTPPN